MTWPAASLHPAVALLPAAPPFFHPLHHPGPPGLRGAAGTGGPGLTLRPLRTLGPLDSLRTVFGAREPDPYHMPPPADRRPHQGQQQERRPGCLEVHMTGDHPGREQASTGDDADEGLHQLALIVHTRIARAHETPELRILPVERLLDLL